MSKGQFAPLTANLLARKGEASPAALVIPLEGMAPTRRRTGIMQQANGAAKMSMVSSTETPKNSKVTKSKSSNGTAHKTKNRTQRSKHLPWDCDTSCNPNGLLPRRTDKFGRAAVTLRLDPALYLCLKLVSAETRRTSQDILTDALTEYLRSTAKRELKDCTCLKKLINGELAIGSS